MEIAGTTRPFGSLAGVGGVSEQELALFLRERRGAATAEDCHKIELDVARIERARDLRVGMYVPQAEVDHHEYDESRH